MAIDAFDDAAPDGLFTLVDVDASRAVVAEVANSLSAHIVRCSGGVVGFNDDGASSDMGV